MLAEDVTRGQEHAAACRKGLIGCGEIPRGSPEMRDEGTDYDCARVEVSREVTPAHRWGPRILAALADDAKGVRNIGTTRPGRVVDALPGHSAVPVVPASLWPLLR